MSTTTKGDGSTATSSVEGLVAQCHGLRAAMGRARLVRRILIIGFLAFFAAFGWLFFTLLKRLGSDEYRNAVAEAAQTRLRERSDEYMKAVHTLVDKSTPALTDAFSKQAKDDLPAYLKALEREGNQFAQDLKAHAETKYRAQVERVLKKYEDILAEELPSLRDIELRKRMVENMAKAFDELGKKYTINPLGDELAKLYDHWDQFPAVAAPGEGETPLEHRVVGSAFELVKNRFIEVEKAQGR